ncbi:restriction endonuclease subunit S [Vibrio harveyi]|uniref:restriction endonuclease subunit S n=1 Tax=Vibrio harveyi TaxID=669 RepID=UPI0023808432|nr:restriction endonuclease subunit S [Vibrio harveyi]
MSELPKGWVELPLEYVASWGSGGTPKRSEPSYYGGDVPWVKTGDLGPRYLKEASEYISQLGLEKSSAKLFPKGSVAIAMYGATIGKTSTLDFEASTNQACAVGNPIDGVILTDFLYYFLTSEKQNFIKKGKGGAQPNISQQLIKAHEIQLPSLAEQKRIVEKLDEVLAQVDTIKARLDGIPDLLKRFRQSVLTSAVLGKLTEEWRGKRELIPNVLSSDFTTKKYGDVVDDEHYDNIPNSWGWVKFGSLVELINGDRGKNYPNKSEYVDEGIAFINTGHIDPDGTLSSKRMNYISEDKFSSLGSGKIQRNDLVYCLRGATMGKTAIVNPFEIGAIASSLVIVRPSESLFFKFAYYFLVSPQAKEQIQRFDNGSAQPNLSAKSLGMYPIGLPPFEEQKEIVRLVDQYFAFADTIEAQVKKAQARVDILTQSILAKAFRGELVDQDPNDEPADKLLERIAEARKEAEALAKAAKKAEAAKKRAAKSV